jgi:CheY-like chemotaxis protein
MESGLDFVKWIKAHPKYKSMPIYILTETASTKRSLSSPENAGALDVLRKPARYADLRTMFDDMAAKLCG